MSKYAIDVSTFNGLINWKEVKASGIDIAIIRVGGRYGVSGKLYTDDKALRNIKGALDNNISIGIYYFTQAINEAEAKEEATWTINFIKDYKSRIELPVYIDSEWLDSGRHNNINKAQRSKVIEAFCSTIKNAGYKAGLYGSTSWLNNNIDITKISKDISIWVADWRSSCGYKGNYDIWQFTDVGKVNGVSGNVDKNIVYKDFQKKEKEYPDKIKVKACDVILGKYGNGAERVKKLGSDYKEVQSLVNELLERLGVL